VEHSEENSKEKQDITNTVRPVLIDGQINTSEWADAQSYDIDDANLLFIKEDEYYYYIAVKSKLAKPLYIDMYINIGDSLFNIHSFSQLGDRALVDSLWTDSSPEIDWGLNKFWSSLT
jgi:hypothetical protein